MAFEDIKAQLSLLLAQAEEQPEDAHEIYENLREILNELKATGMPLPEDLVELEHRLEQQFQAGTLGKKS